LTTSVVYFFNHVSQSEWFVDVPLMGQGMAITTLVPTVEFPDVDFSMINQLVPISFAIALLGIVESTCAAKMMSTMTGQPISTNREILSVGLGNLVSSFIGALPIALSPLRSTINLISGAKTRLSGFFCTLFLALLVSLFAFIVNLIPLTALSAMILMTAGYLVHVRETLVCLKATPQDRFVLIATFLACIFFSLDVAFYIGVVLSITTYLRKAAEPQLQEYRVQDTGELYSLRSSVEAESKVIRVIKVEGELFFGATHVFESSLKSFARDHKSTKVIILQLKNARDIDASTCVTLLDLADSLKAAGCHLLIAGITPPIWEVLSISGVVEALGKENLFLFDDANPHYYMKKAFQRAKSLTQIEESPKEVVLDPEPLTLLDPVS
jgi:SulP family sulfate permease